MNNVSKLMLSDEELQLVNDSSWILTKRVIVDKVGGLLGVLSEGFKTVIDKEKVWLPEAVVQSSPKIAKGENYLQLPYLLLDYPRCFDSENIFAVRTMFWWGNYFSISLLLSGSYKEMFEKTIYKNLHFAKHDFFICINESPWQHHFEADNYTLVKQLSKTDLQNCIFKKQFVKLAIKFPLHQWDDVITLLEKSFEEIIGLLKD